MLKLTPEEEIKFTTKFNSDKIRFDLLVKSKLPNSIFNPILFDEFIEIYELEEFMPDFGFSTNGALDDIKQGFDIDAVLEKLENECVKSEKKTILISDLQFFQVEVGKNGSMTNAPIKVVECGDLLTGESRYILIDGYHRVAERLCNNDYLQPIPCDIYL